MWFSRITLLCISTTILSACVTASANIEPDSIGDSDDLRLGEAPPASPDDVSLDALEKDDEPDIAPIRANALQEGAYSYGSQMGHARRSWEIMRILEQRSGDVSEAFDFNRVTSEAPVKAGVVIPPIVSRDFDAFDMDSDGREVAVADEFLTIIRPGRLAPVAPTWRDYLVLPTSEPDPPAQSLLPVDREEKRKFETWFGEGWEAGVELAESEFEERLDRLNRDYAGMLQYRRLVAQDMMDRMVLEDADFGVTGEDNEMRIGNRMVRITSDAAFQAEPDGWDIQTISQRDVDIVETGEIPPLMQSARNEILGDEPSDK